MHPNKRFKMTKFEYELLLAVAGATVSLLPAGSRASEIRAMLYKLHIDNAVPFRPTEPEDAETVARREL